ncbi:hypothetical protein ZWY2020_019112 [Hordeum vulgare]|nr:hypothetical protein ZWY2020_019112 [Hordeum vulgare]
MHHRRRPLPFSIDLVRWLPSVASASSRLSLLPLHHPDSLLASLPLTSRPAALRCSPSILAAATSSGSLHLLSSSFDTHSTVSVPAAQGGGQDKPSQGTESPYSTT